MRVCSIVPRIIAPTDFLGFGIAVQTLDLVRSCPIWATLGPGSALLRRILGLRERWSYRTITVAGPQTTDDVDVQRTGRTDLHTMLQLSSHWACLSPVFWHAIGPPELLDDLRGKKGGTRTITWSRAVGNELFVAAVSMSLFLCQHEIRGD